MLMLSDAVVPEIVVAICLSQQTEPNRVESSQHKAVDPKFKNPGHLKYITNAIKIPK